MHVVYMHVVYMLCGVHVVWCTCRVVHMHVVYMSCGVHACGVHVVWCTCRAYSVQRNFVNLPLFIGEDIGGVEVGDCPNCHYRKCIMNLCTEMTMNGRV